jgi:hypothetical protein
MAQTVFERIEKKYLLTAEQYAALAPRLAARMQPDAYGRYTIGNIYYDTPDYALIRASLAGPVYKEKLRLRCYGTPCADSTVFLELKKKYRGVVYKRRASMPLAAAEEYLAGGAAPALPRPEPAAPSGAQPPAADPAQILREMDYFLSFYHPEAKVCLSYDRTAFFCPEEPELRVTFDENIRWRTWDMTLAAGAAGRTARDGGARADGDQDPGRDAAVAFPPARRKRRFPFVLFQIRVLLRQRAFAAPPDCMGRCPLCLTVFYPPTPPRWAKSPSRSSFCAPPPASCWGWRARGCICTKTSTAAALSSRWR